jgi:signal transduction histidine kinase
MKNSMEKSFKKSRTLQQSALSIIPLGVNSNFRYWGDGITPYVDKAKGAYLWDVDGNRYIDYRLAFGPIILGHAYEAVDQKVHEEIDKGNIPEVKTILNDIKENEQKINQHGKRADAIVKGMLQHSQSSSGVKEPTDINALADEYLRLAYHGLKAKDKSFNATLKTAFDPTVGQIKIIPQDIGRVLLNLYNNAFYAVAEKKKQSVEGYEPLVSVSTKLINGDVEISVSDNGNGIPEQVRDKVFQPFFTTKPTGQGTGLGLSLSYDIIKAHQGKINIRNSPGTGVEFIITLPVNA